MITNKILRSIMGFTQQAQARNPAAWHNNAVSFHQAARVLYSAQEIESGRIRVFALNAALSLELLLKAILVRKGVNVPTGRKGHNLTKLSENAGVNLGEDQQSTLQLLEEMLIWAARYPAPKKEEAWDNFHDSILERHKTRSKKGNVFTVRANPKTYPSLENYEAIWSICLTEYEALDN